MEIPQAGRTTVKPPGVENPGGWGGQPGKNPPWGEYEYFLEPHICPVPSPY